MQKLVINILVFTSTFLLFVKGIGYLDNIDKQRADNPNIVRITIENRFDSLDILFVGSSGSYSGINPAYFDSIGLRTYNLSIAAAGPFFYELMIDDYLKQVKKKPKSIFVLIMPSTFMEKSDNFEEIGVHRYLNSPISNEIIIQRYNQWKSYPILLLKSFQKGVKNMFIRIMPFQNITESIIKDKGFYRSDEVTSSAKEKREYSTYRYWKMQDFPFDKFTYLMQYTRELEEQGIKIVFFTVPSNKASSFFSSDYINNFKDVKSQIKKEYTLFDLATLQLDSSCYRNSDHLNTHGASIVSKKIVSDVLDNLHLKTLFNIPDSVDSVN